MSKRREEIPSSVKLEVRRRCGFGCVICGLPLYEYHHIVPYALLRTHDPRNIALLCDRHHKEATNGLLPPTKIEEANLRPFNKLRKVSTPFGLHFKSPIEVVIGGNSLAKVMAGDKLLAVTAIRIDEVELVGLQVSKSGELSLSARIFTVDGSLILRIQENEIIFSVERAWDVEFKGKTLTIREEKRKVLLKLRFDPPHRVSIVQGIIAYMGALVFVFPKAIVIANTLHVLQDIKLEGFELGLYVGDENKVRGLAAYGVILSSDERSLAASDVEYLRQQAHKLTR